MVSIQELFGELFKELPLDAAMEHLTPSGPISKSATAAVERLLASRQGLDAPELAAGLWLYVDELDRSHRISQQIETPTGAFWHGIMHRREGDFDNAHYWFRRVGSHPAMAAIPGYDGHAFIDAVAAANGKNLEDLVALQRQEWRTLFSWCFKQRSAGMHGE